MEQEQIQKIVERIVTETVDKVYDEGKTDSGQTTQGKDRFNYTRNVNLPLIFAANWKMNMTFAETMVYANTLKNIIKTQSLLPRPPGPKYNFDREVIICPSYHLIPMLSRLLEETPVKFGAQNMYFEEKGAYTGEISPRMLQDMNCGYVILGHSERRWVFNETDETINKKVIAAIQHGIKPILCVGEKLEERETKATNRILKNQLVTGLRRTNVNEVSQLVVAYEPVWAIGTGNTATPQQAQEAHYHIRTVLEEIYNFNIAKNIRILYGGSVTEDNCQELIDQPDLDGFLIGGASLDPARFEQIIRSEPTASP